MSAFPSASTSSSAAVGVVRPTARRARWWRRAVLAMYCVTGLLAPLPPAGAAEFTMRASVLVTAADADPGQLGAGLTTGATPSADQESLRLMFDALAGETEWSLHLRTLRQNLRGFPALNQHSSALFRYRDLAGNWISTSDGINANRVGYELDRALVRRRFGNLRLSLGRQPVDWGEGRFWQPLNVFGAFAPVDLDTDYKPGIDAAVLDWYPSASSALTAAYAFAPQHDSPVPDSGAVHYQRQVGEQSQLAVLAGRVIGKRVIGASFASEISGMGWRIEALHTDFGAGAKSALFWIAGCEYRFAGGTTVSAEWHDNSRGATSEGALAAAPTDLLLRYGLQQQLGRRVLALAIERDLTPLMSLGYKVLASTLRDPEGNRAGSLLHQVSLVYSVSNESDLMLALQTATGKSLSAAGLPRSEFGHLPLQLTLRWRSYF